MSQKSTTVQALQYQPDLPAVAERMERWWRGEYLGRTCHWRKCGPGFRLRCDALHCGRRLYLHDDLRSVRLDARLVAEPPIELWPAVQTRGPVPGDVEAIVLAALRASAVKPAGGETS